MKAAAAKILAQIRRWSWAWHVMFLIKLPCFFLMLITVHDFFLSYPDRQKDRWTNRSIYQLKIVLECCDGFLMDTLTHEEHCRKNLQFFLGATKHLYNWLCPLVGWSVGWLVGRSVGNAFIRRSTRRTYWPTWPCFLTYP